MKDSFKGVIGSWRRTLITCVVLFCLGFSLCASADELDHWVWRQPQPFSLHVNAVAHGNGLWVLFANSGMVATSPDGTQWDLANAATNALFLNATFGNGCFVTTSSRGVLYSIDGHSWFPAASPGYLNYVTFGNGLFVGADGSSATIWRSTDGTNWTSQGLGGLDHFDTVSYANHRYFMLGTDYTYQNYLFYTSLDATNWTGPVALGTSNIQKIVYGNGVFVGINSPFSPTGTWSEFRTSTDGATWSAPMVITNTLVSDIVFANGQFVALDAGGQVLLSANGTNWSAHAAPDLFATFALGWNNGQFLASGLFGKILTSADGTNWVQQTKGSLNSLLSVIYTNGLYVAVGGNMVPDGADFYSQPTVVMSTNVTDWTAHDPGTSNSLAAVTYGNGRYIAVGTNGVIVTSTDAGAAAWAAVSSPTTDTLYSVAYGNGRFVAVGGDSNNRATILNSTDGATWNEQTDATNYSALRGLVWGANQFVAVGFTNASKMATILTSPDGATWTPQTTTATNNLYAVTYGNGHYVAVGDRSAVSTSPDGVNWTTPLQGTLPFLRTVAYGHGWYIASGYPAYPGGLLVSSNAVDWTHSTAFDLVTKNALYGLTYGADSFVAVGKFGEVLESGSFNPPAPVVTEKLRYTDRPMLSFTGPENRAYEIDSADTLPPSWQTLTVLSNYSATTTLPVAAATNSNSRFYQVKLLP